MDGKEVSLKKLRCDEATEILGIWIALDRDTTKLIRTLKLLAVEWDGKIRMGHSSPDEAWTALHTHISAKLEYILTTCTLIIPKCKSIISTAIKAALPRSGIVSNIAVDNRDGPVGSLAVGVLPLYHYRYTSQTAYVIDQISRKTPLGDTMIVNIEDLIIEHEMYGDLCHIFIHKISKYADKHSWTWDTYTNAE